MQEITDVTNNPLLLNPQFSSQATSYQQHFLSWLPRCHPSLTRSCVTIAPSPSFLLVPFPLPSILGWLVPQFLIPSLLMTPRYVSLTHTSPELQAQLAISTWISSRHLQLSPKLIFGSFPGKKKKKEPNPLTVFLFSIAGNFHVFNCSGQKPLSVLVPLPSTPPPIYLIACWLHFLKHIQNQTTFTATTVLFSAQHSEWSFET